MPLPPVLRRFTRAPMFTATALITLAIGIGANTAVFSVVNGVLIRPLPYPQSEELVGVWHSAPGVGFKDGTVNVSPTLYLTYRDESRTFRDVGIWSRGGVTVTIRSAAGYGSGRRRTALTTLKTAVLAPIPTAMMPMASAVKPGLRSSVRPA